MSGLRDGLGRSVSGLELADAVASAHAETSPDGIGDEVERIARDLFEMMSAHRVQIMVLDRCAPELPRLAGDWYESGRSALVDMWVEYLSDIDRPIGPHLDRDVLARSIVELITVWAVKIPWDPAPRTYTPDLAESCALMVRNLVTGAFK